MKLLKTLFLALVGLALTNCGVKEEDQIRKIDSSVPNLQEAKAAFEKSYAEHLNLVLKRTNQLQRDEHILPATLQKEFEDQWSSQLDNLKALAKFASEEDLKQYLNNVFDEHKNQGILATPCYDEYVKNLNEANESFLLCDLIALATGGEGLVGCAIYYIDKLRVSYNNYASCLQKEYGNQSGKQ